MSGIARSVVKGRRGLRLVLVNLPVLAACTYLYTLGMLHRAHRQIAGQIATQVRVRLWPRRYVPTVPLAALVPGPVDLHLEELTSTFSNVSVDELMALAALVRVSGARTVLEIGTFDGRTALNLAANLPPDGHVYTLDLPPAGPDGPTGDTSSVFPLDPAARKRTGSPAPGARFHHTC